MTYYYLGLNLRSPKFSDKRVRQALAHLLDIPSILKTVYYNLGEQVIGPVNPAKKKEYNNEIIPYAFDPEKAKSLLADAGWKDSNGDGIVDRMIDGKKQEFTIDFIYNAGNEERKAVGLIFQES